MKSASRTPFESAKSRSTASVTVQTDTPAGVLLIPGPALNAPSGRFYSACQFLLYLPHVFPSASQLPDVPAGIYGLARSDSNG